MSDVTMIPTDQLTVDDDNVRRRRPHIDQLAESIREQGVLIPLIVRPAGDGRYTVVDGGSRLEAARQAGVVAIPCLVRNMSDRTALISSATANVQRRAMDPVEQAEAFRDAMHRHGLTQVELGRLVGVSQTHISRHLKLLQLDPDVQEQVAAGQLSVHRALRHLPKAPGRTVPHRYPAKRRAAGQPTDAAATAEQLERLTGSDDSEPGYLKAPPGTTLVPIPNDALDMARRAAASRKMPLLAYIVQALRPTSRRAR